MNINKMELGWRTIEGCTESRGINALRENVSKNQRVRNQGLTLRGDNFSRPACGDAADCKFAHISQKNNGLEFGETPDISRTERECLDVTIAALYVQTGGSYYGLPGVDPLPELRWGVHPVRDEDFPPEAVKKHGIKYCRRAGLMAFMGGGKNSAPRIATPPEFRDLLISMARGTVTP